MFLNKEKTPLQKEIQFLSVEMSLENKYVRNDRLRKVLT